MKAHHQRMKAALQELANVRRRMDVLEEILRELSDVYYNEAESVVSDALFDTLMGELETLEAAHPELASAESPTQTIGSAPRATAATLEHIAPVLGLRKAKNYGDVDRFLTRVQAAVIVEEKIDGLTAIATYRDGRLATLGTRGNGKVGVDVTHNVGAFCNLPAKISHDVAIQGEAYITYTELERVNYERRKAGRNPFDSARTAAASILLSREAPAGVLSFKPTEYIGGELPSSVDTHGFFLSWCSVANDFVATEDTGRCTNSKTLRENIKWMNDMRSRFDYATDGVVIKVDDYRRREALGANKSEPYWAIAYKRVAYDRSVEH